MHDRRLLILGAGALAREIVLALPAAMARLAEHRLSVVIASRDPERAGWLACLGAARATLGGAATDFRSAAVSWNGQDRLAELLHAEQPQLILHTASLQSAWSLGDGNSWSAIVGSAGYGLTAALQMALLPVLGRAMKVSGVTALLVNACYPDFVNGCARQLGVDVACGLGNVALLADWFRRTHPPWRGEMLRVLAGHWDVQQFQRRDGLRRDVPRVWVGEDIVPLELLLGIPVLPADPSLNAFNASASARLICAMVFAHDARDLHVPGPCSLPGGYPVALERGMPKLDLPAGISRDDAVSWNRARNLLDGVTLDGDRVRFSPDAAERLHAVAPGLCDGFDLADTEAAASAFLRLREELSAKPACG